MKIKINIIYENSNKTKTIVELDKEKWDFLCENYDLNYENCCNDIMDEIVTKIKNNIDLPEEWYIEYMDLAD